MKLKFDANLTYQTDAVQAVVDVFDGQPLSRSGFEVSFTEQVGMIEQTELGLGNRLTLSDEELLANVRAVQARNDIDPVEELQGKQFSIEMETGTGKTYVYLRTIFELNRQYGFKKFIIVVPSVAIREGTLKNLQVTEEHFKGIYDKVPVNYYVYDSTKISQLRQFAASNQIQILIINIDAFRKVAVDADDKKGNVIHRDNDRLSGRRPIEFIQATNPIVIVDEPQSVDNTPKAQEAMATLNPLCTLRYSATHRNPYNLLYKLDPIRAYDMRLVKRIEVASVEPSFELKVAPEHEEIRHEIVDAMQRFEFRGRVVNKSDRRTLKLNKQVYLDPEFAELWNRINQQTTYSVEYSTADLIRDAAKAVAEMPAIEAVRIVSGKGEIAIAEGGVDSKILTTDQTTYVTHQGRLPDLLAYLQKETELTRKTLFEILAESGRLADFPKNPQRFMMEGARLINITLNQLVLDGIKYEKIGGDIYEMRLFEEEEIVRYLENLVETQKSVYDCIEFESEVERRFARDLNNMDEIKLFVKLPARFQIKTPIGPYNPDWAIVKNGDQTVYMVRETKGTKDLLKSGS